MAYTFKSIFTDRTLYWRLAWATLIPFTLFALLHLGLYIALENSEKAIKEKTPAYGFIDNKSLIPFYKKKLLEAQNNTYQALEEKNWQAIAEEKKLNYVIEFKRGKDSATYIEIWTKQKAGFEDLRYKLQLLEAERQGIQPIKILQKDWKTAKISEEEEKDVAAIFSEIFQYLGSIIHTLVALLILFFASWVNRYIAIDCIENKGDNAFWKTLSYIFVPAFLAIILVLFGIYRGCVSTQQGHGLFIWRNLKIYLSDTYLIWILAMGAVISWLLSSIWLWHNLKYVGNLYQNMRSGNRYYIFILYFSLIGGISGLIGINFIKYIPVINLFIVGKDIINQTFTYLDIAIFFLSNIALSFIFLYWAKKKYVALADTQL